MIFVYFCIFLKSLVWIWWIWLGRRDLIVMRVGRFRGRPGILIVVCLLWLMWLISYRRISSSIFLIGILNWLGWFNWLWEVILWLVLFAVFLQLFATIFRLFLLWDLHRERNKWLWRLRKIRLLAQKIVFLWNSISFSKNNCNNYKANMINLTRILNKFAKKMKN